MRYSGAECWLRSSLLSYALAAVGKMVMQALLKLLTWKQHAKGQQRESKGGKCIPTYRNWSLEAVPLWTKHVRAVDINEGYVSGTWVRGVKEQRNLGEVQLPTEKCLHLQIRLLSLFYTQFSIFDLSFIRCRCVPI